MVANPRGKFVTDGYRRVQDQVGKGTGKIKGSVVFDQIYAQNQHESVWFKHPHGGQAKYLEEPLLGNAQKYMARLAEGLLRDGIENSMVYIMDDLASESADRAPIEYGYLAGSAHPSVTRGNTVIYDKKAYVRRLSEEELKTIHRNKGSL